MSTISEIESYLGRKERLTENLSPVPAERMAALMDAPRAFVSGDALPHLWHWFYFISPAAQSDIGSDGHELSSRFMPADESLRRMWAGARLQFLEPLRIGQPLTRQGKIRAVRQTRGNAGLMHFVTADFEISDDEGPLIDEELDLVFLQPGATGQNRQPAKPAPQNQQWRDETRLNAVQLFRYSALTFNGHRIHYDRDYCRSLGHPGLVVHGPLLATLLMDSLLKRFAAENIQSFSVRAIQAHYEDLPLFLCGHEDGEGAQIWAANTAGELLMTGQATLMR